MKPIETRADIELLVDAFYKKVVQDEVIGFFFTDVVKLDWEVHIPVIYDFWETILLGNIRYKGNPMVKHIKLSEKEPLLEEHFKRWLSLWTTTVDEHFEGPKAREAKNRAEQIGALMMYKTQQNHHP